ncbi:MAG: hypothetical protein WBP28_13445 [Nostocoides sp.]
MASMPKAATMEGIARAFGVPPLSAVVLHAARATGVPVDVVEVEVASPSALSDDDLVGEIRRRLARTADEEDDNDTAANARAGGARTSREKGAGGRPVENGVRRLRRRPIQRGASRMSTEPTMGGRHRGSLIRWGAFVGLALALVIVRDVTRDDPEPGESREVAAQLVQRECQRVVRERLKNPTTAEFSDVRQTFAAASGTVVSENSLGGKVTVTYRCVVRDGVTQLEAMDPL